MVFSQGSMEMDECHENDSSDAASTVSTGEQVAAAAPVPAGQQQQHDQRRPRSHSRSMRLPLPPDQSGSTPILSHSSRNEANYHIKSMEGDVGRKPTSHSHCQFQTAAAMPTTAHKSRGKRGLHSLSGSVQQQMDGTMSAGEGDYDEGSQPPSSSDKRLRREIANSNERRRMQCINNGFLSLQTILPKTYMKRGEKMSKAAILQATVEYITKLETDNQKLLGKDELYMHRNHTRSQSHSPALVLGQLAPMPPAIALAPDSGTESAEEGVTVADAGSQASFVDFEQLVKVMNSINNPPAPVPPTPGSRPGSACSSSTAAANSTATQLAHMTNSVKDLVNMVQHWRQKCEHERFLRTQAQEEVRRLMQLFQPRIQQPSSMTTEVKQESSNSPMTAALQVSNGTAANKLAAFGDYQAFLAANGFVMPCISNNAPAATLLLPSGMLVDGNGEATGQFPAVTFKESPQAGGQEGKTGGLRCPCGAANCNVLVCSYNQNAGRNRALTGFDILFEAITYSERDLNWDYACNRSDSGCSEETSGSGAASSPLTTDPAANHLQTGPPKKRPRRSAPAPTPVANPSERQLS